MNIEGYISSCVTYKMQDTTNRYFRWFRSGVDTTKNAGQGGMHSESLVPIFCTILSKQGPSPVLADVLRAGTAPSRFYIY